MHSLSSYKSLRIDEYDSSMDAERLNKLPSCIRKSTDNHIVAKTKAKNKKCYWRMDIKVRIALRIK